MVKSRASFLKRQREIAKKEQRAEKLQRKRERKEAAEIGDGAGSGLPPIAWDEMVDSEGLPPEIQEARQEAAEESAPPAAEDPESPEGPREDEAEPDPRPAR